MPDQSVGKVIDPTKNVLDLVDAAIGRQDDLRAAETKRLNDLAALREAYETRISNLLRVQVENTSVLLSTQLDRVTTALTDRIAKLEQFRWETGGQTAGVGNAASTIYAVIGAAGVIVAIAVALLK